MICDKCGKPMRVYLVRHNFPWEKRKTEKWCCRCAGLGALFARREEKKKVVE